ncbi:low affinity iron permease family protein [Mesorhizobium sp.]
MTLFIQRAEHRDTQALHAKLDELLRAVGEADSETAKIDDKEPEEIETQRERKQQAIEPCQRSAEAGPDSDELAHIPAKSPPRLFGGRASRKAAGRMEKTGRASER